MTDISKRPTDGFPWLCSFRSWSLVSELVIHRCENHGTRLQRNARSWRRAVHRGKVHLFVPASRCPAAATHPAAENIRCFVRCWRTCSACKARISRPIAVELLGAPRAWSAALGGPAASPGWCSLVHRSTQLSSILIPTPARFDNAAAAVLDCRQCSASAPTAFRGIGRLREFSPLERVLLFRSHTGRGMGFGDFNCSADRRVCGWQVLPVTICCRPSSEPGGIHSCLPRTPSVPFPSAYLAPPGSSRFWTRSPQYLNPFM